MPVFSFRKIHLLVALTLTHTFSPALQAEVITDGSVGAAQTLSGPDFTIPQSLGHTVGTNLFHSFQSFNLAQPESATFTGSDNMQNVISRVTGGQASSIDGTLNSQVGQANFYFINPSGVVFGPNAQVNVPGDFHVSTANGLRFEDGSVFSVFPDHASTLSMATPAEFGFLNDQSASIRIEGSQLRFEPGSQVSLSAGSIQISGEAVTRNDEGKVVTDNRGALISPAGEVYLQAAEDLQMDHTLIDVDGNRVGRIAISAGDTTINSSQLSAFNSGDGPVLSESGIELDVATLQLENTEILTYTTSSDHAGSITLTATGDMVLDNSSVLSATFGAGNTGSVKVTSEGTLSILNGASINGRPFEESDGNGNLIRIQAHALTIDQQNSDTPTGIFNLVSGSGNGGDIQVNVETNLNLNGDKATIDTNSLEGGAAGSIDIRVKDSLSLRGGSISSSTFGNKTDAGIINVHASDITLQGGFITSRTAGAGNGGQIIIQADTLLIDAFEGAASIGTETFSLGDAGSINIIINSSLDILNGGSISSSSSIRSISSLDAIDPSSGNAGRIHVQAEDILIQGNSIHSSTISSDSFGEGKAGSITVLAEHSLSLTQGGFISNLVLGRGDGGKITIQAENLLIDGHDGSFITGIFSNARNILDRRANLTGNAGDVDINVEGSLTILNAGRIDSSTSGDGKAGIIQVQAGNTLIDGIKSPSSFTGIRSSALTGSTGNGGKVHIETSGTLQLLNGGNIASVTNSSGQGGQVVVEADIISMRDDNNSPGLTGVSVSSSGSGQAGEIILTAKNSLTIANTAQINSSTFGEGAAGDIEVTAGSITLHGDVNSDFLTGIASTAELESSGQVGSITLHTDHLLSSGGSISIASRAQPDTAVVTDETGIIRIEAETIRLNNDSSIDARSSNAIPASALDIIATESLHLDHSSITTSATESSGGNIQLNPEVLILDGGYIQANAQGDGNDGGNVTINTDTIIASQGNLQTGGALVAYDPDSDQNIIQATAEAGVSGELDFPSPQLDISGSLLPLDNELIDLAALIKNPCDNPNIRNSKLTRLGRGRLPENITEARSVPLTPQRLAQISTTPQRTADSLTQPTADTQQIQLALGDIASDCGH